MKEWYQTAAGVLGALISVVTGLSPLLKILLVVMSIDYVTGLISAAMGVSPKTEGGHLSSHAAFDGLMRKVGILLIVALASLLDLAVANGAGVKFSATSGTVSLWFVASEGMSVLENVAAMGVPIPKKLRDMLEIMRDKNQLLGDGDDEDEEITEDDEKSE